MSEERLPLVTVLTPTFNRAETLPRLYRSLQEQDSNDFEWLVVDDGSADGTPELVAGWAAEAPFPIRYRYQENAGKHVALNRGVESARGRYVAVIDSDDWYAPGALKRMLAVWHSIPAEQRNSFAEVQGLCADPDGLPLGQLPADVIDSDNVEIRMRYGMLGDAQGMLRTEVMREFPFPEDLGRFVAESLIWNRMARRYRTRYVNEVFAHKEYRPDGLTAGGRRHQVESSAAALLFQKELLSGHWPLPPRVKLRLYANYVRHSLHERIGPVRQRAGAPSKLWWALTAPIGLALYARDRWEITR